MKANQDFDEAAFNALKEMMEDRFSVLAEKFTRNAALYVQKVEQAALAKDRENIIQNAHALKSSSAMLGFMGLQRCVTEIEGKVRNGEIDLDDEITRLRAYLEHSLTVLKPYLL